MGQDAGLLKETFVHRRHQGGRDLSLSALLVVIAAGALDKAKKMPSSLLFRSQLRGKDNFLLLKHSRDHVLNFTLSF